MYVYICVYIAIHAYIPCVYIYIETYKNPSHRYPAHHHLPPAPCALLCSFNTPQQSGNEAKTSSSRPKETPPKDPAYKDAVKAAWAGENVEQSIKGVVLEMEDPQVTMGFNGE